MSIEEKDWEEFRGTGLLLFVNQFLHIFGWCLVFEYDDKDTLFKVFPAKTKYRGFSGQSQTEAYARLSKYMVETVELKETHPSPDFELP